VQIVLTGVYVIFIFNDHRRQFLVAAFWLIASMTPVLAQSGALDDCNSDDTVRQLKGCTSLIKQEGLRTGDLALAHSRRSDAHLAGKKLDAVIADRSKAVELEPNDATYKKRLSQAYSLRAALAAANEKFQQAIVDYTTAINVDSTSVEAHIGRSEVFFQLKEPDKSVEDLKTLVNLDNNEWNRRLLASGYAYRSNLHFIKKNMIWRDDQDGNRDNQGENRGGRVER
jgi:tetratricopeptide (TPR) repeat protein